MTGLPEALISAGSAVWLGILTSMSPCPLATNVAAISFLGRSVDSPRRVLGGGLLAGWLLANAALAGPTWKPEPSPFADDPVPRDPPRTIPSRNRRKAGGIPGAFAE